MSIHAHPCGTNNLWSSPIHSLKKIISNNFIPISSCVCWLGCGKSGHSHRGVLGHTCSYDCCLVSVDSYRTTCDYLLKQSLCRFSILGSTLDKCLLSFAFNFVSIHESLLYRLFSHSQTFAQNVLVRCMGNAHSFSIIFGTLAMICTNNIESSVLLSVRTLLNNPYEAYLW